MPTPHFDRRLLRLALHWSPILMLHEVLPDDTTDLPPYSITQSGLRAVLSDFAAHGYSSGTIDDVLTEQGLDGANGAPPKPRGKRVVLTFDDGTNEFLDNALPV